MAIASAPQPSLEETAEVKRTLALRVTPSTFAAYEKTARLLGTTNSNLLGVVLKFYIEQKIENDYEKIVKAQVNEIMDEISKLDETTLITGRMDRLVGEEPATSVRTAKKAPMTALETLANLDEVTTAPKTKQAVSKRRTRRTRAQIDADNKAKQATKQEAA